MAKKAVHMVVLLHNSHEVYTFVHVYMIFQQYTHHQYLIWSLKQQQEVHRP